jgi:hypothetical protein
VLLVEEVGELLGDGHTSLPPKKLGAAPPEIKGRALSGAVEVVESGSVQSAAKEEDVGGETEKGDQQTERPLHGDGEPDGSRQGEERKAEESEPRGRRRAPDRDACAHGDRLAPAPRRSPEEGLKSS